jgi:hypothetical protein
VAKTKTKIKKIAEKPYKLTIQVNGLVFSKRPKDLFLLKKAIQAIKPEIVYTEMFIDIIKGDYSFNRRFNLVQTKKIFNNEDMLDILILNNILQ